MNKSAIQKYAIWARTEMIAQVEQRAYQYGITAGGYGEENAMVVQGRALSNQEQEQRWELIQQIKHKGFTQVMEEVAYTWFNRFIALRFMEVNNYLPTHIRVFSDSTGAFKPEILSNAMQIDLDGLDLAKVAEMIDANQTEELYRYLLVTQCNALNEALPKMFEKMGGYTELLLPNNILRPDGILGRMVNEIPEEDWTDQVQIIGWLYQYYNSELKDDTFALLKKNVKITKERIPSATQLFTPDWIVRYMVENSLGRLWLEHLSASEEGYHYLYDENGNCTASFVNMPESVKNLKSNWKYYLDEAPQEPQVQEQLKKIRSEYANMTPQGIKVIDPCMGSGHILVYAFDVLVQIYKSHGISERDAAKLILEKNLYGLDIDDRAAQLAYFAVMMKARQYDRRIFSRGVEPHIYAIQESNHINRRHLKFFGWQLSDLERNLALNQLNTVLDEFNDAKEYGSILNISRQDWDLLYRFVGSVDYSDQMTLEAMGLEDTKDKLFELVQIAATMAQKYDVVVTNPPYMGAGGMGAKLTAFAKKEYPETKSDMSTVFMEKTLGMCSKCGYMSMINIPVWMFLSTYEKMRGSLLAKHTIVNMNHFGRGVFGSDFGTTAFIIAKRKIENYIGTYRRLFETQGAVDSVETKEQWFLEGKGSFTANQNKYAQIPGTPIAYWVSNNFFAMFEQPALRELAFAGIGMRTGDNDRFLRFWHEVNRSKMKVSCRNASEAVECGAKWIPYNKGGDFRRWYGNNQYVVNWENDGYEIKENTRKVYPQLGDNLGWKISNEQHYFKPGITWTVVSSKYTSFRRYYEGAIISNSGQSVIAEDSDFLDYLTALLNTKIVMDVLAIISPTIGFESGYINKIPVIVDNEEYAEIAKIARNCIERSKTDWDAFETSWDFQRHPLLSYAAFTSAQIAAEQANGYLPLNTLADAYRHWEQACNDRFDQLKANEEELNRIFIDIYGLQDELTPEVEDKDVTVRKADLSRDIRSLISYAVGCMFGRYSLDIPGLAYAGGEWDASKYQTIIPDADNIIPICDDEYFDDDITARFVKWVETVYGKETLEENLKFIAAALGGKGTPRQVIRNYFLNDFYAGHLKIYQKRPIYWLFDSGKKNGFKALIYMHRYQSDLLARMRTDYVHEMQERYRTQLTHLAEAISHAPTSERVKLNKQQKKIQDQALELQKYEEKIHHLADQNISIDLDDGVKHNYALFADVLAKIK